MRNTTIQPRRTITPDQQRRVFTWWRDKCLKRSRKRDERFKSNEVMLGIQLSISLLHKDADTLSDEWAKPAIDALELLGQSLLFLELYQEVRRGISEEERAHCLALEERLDWAVSMIHRSLGQVTSRRVRRTRNDDLLLDLLCEKIGEGTEAVALLRHIEKNLPHVDKLPNGELDSENTIASFAWDTYQRVALLDHLVDEYPRHLRPVARQMHAWPMLRHPHTSSDTRFATISENLALGADYPLDTRKTARFRPDSPMVQYLDGLIPRLNLIRENCRRHNSTTDHDLLHWWGMDQTYKPKNLEPNKAALDVLRILKDLPSLTKSSATSWTKNAVVPFVLATDASGSGPYTERAIEQIRQQRDIKSRAIFQSRLESKIGKTLRSLAKSE